MKNSKVLVLLATYNGEKYIREMIDSVVNQNFDDFHIIVSDDGSSDSTADILTEYAENNPQLVTHYKSGERFGNAQNHFMHLLKEFHNSDYIMFCDQDDFWHSDKIRKTIAKMQEIETEKALPALVHTDLRVVDKNMSLIDSSFMNFSKLDGTRMNVNQILVQNVVTGCTMMINRALAEKAVNNIPASGMLMHDWWLALIASVFGQTGFVNAATIDYRQHGNNVVGAKNVTSPAYLLERLKSGSMKKSLNGAAEQAEVFLACFGDTVPQDKKAIIEDFAKTKGASLLKKDLVYLKHRLYKYGVIRVLAQFIGG